MADGSVLVIPRITDEGMQLGHGRHVLGEDSGDWTGWSIGIAQKDCS